MRVMCAGIWISAGKRDAGEGEGARRGTRMVKNYFIFRPNKELVVDPGKEDVLYLVLKVR